MKWIFTDYAIDEYLWAALTDAQCDDARKLVGDVRELRDAAEAVCRGVCESKHLCEIDPRLIERLRKALGLPG